MPADIEIRQFSLTQQVESHSWTAQIVLAEKADWDRLSIGDPLDIQMGNVAYNLVVDNKQLQRQSAAVTVPLITAVSPVSLYGPPDSERITRTWTTVVTAKSAAEEVLQQTIDWQIVDWQIEPERLAFTDATPLDIARSIVQAAGGVLRSKPDGTLQAVKRYPISVPNWITASPDHTLSDLVDNVTIIEQQRRREVVNKVFTSSQTTNLSRLQMQIDSRPDGLNQGNTSFAPGDTVGVLVWAPDGVTLDPLQTSSGTTTIEADQQFQHTEDLHYSATDSATLLYPADSIESVTWLGNDLGALALDVDGQTTFISAPGVGVCRVVYNVTAKAFRVTTEQDINGLTEYPVQLHIEADPAGATSQRSIIGQRGNGDKNGADISEPILTDINALLARATTELDTGEGLQPVTLNIIYREGLELGQIALIQDSQQGPEWRGMITGINHKYDGIKTLTNLEILKR